MQPLKRFLLPALCALAAAAPVMFLVPHRSEAQQFSSPVRLVRNDENPARQPFVATVNGFATSLSDPPIKLSPSVPAGQRLIIENVGAVCDVRSGTRLTAVLLATTSGSNQTYPLPMASQGTFPQNNADVFAVEQQVRLYADPQSTVSFNVRVNTFSAAECSVTISGTLVNVP